MRDTAGAPQPPTNPPKGHKMSRQGLAQNEQKCQFQAKFGRFWAKNPNFYWRKQKFCYPRKGLSIYYVIRDWGVSSRFITILHRGGSPQFITILHRGGFEKKMECNNPFLALNKVKSHHFILFNVILWLRILSRIMKNIVNTCF